MLRSEPHLRGGGLWVPNSPKTVNLRDLPLENLVCIRLVIYAHIRQRRESKMFKSNACKAKMTNNEIYVNIYTKLSIQKMFDHLNLWFKSVSSTK
jgi:hypothetical protein